MSFGDIMTTEYWGVPLWGWILIVVGIVLIIGAIKAATAKKKEGETAVKKEGDVETGTAKLPEGEAAAQEFPRDAPLPPPAPSETSRKG